MIIILDKNTFILLKNTFLNFHYNFKYLKFTSILYIYES
jgi:hypothetical protein